MKVELDRIGMIHLVCGTEPGVSMREELEGKNLGYSDNGSWNWDREELRKYDNPKLMTLYKRLRAE